MEEALPYKRQSITIINRSGLHARAAAKFSQTADRFQATVIVEKGHQTASADSILDLMMLMANQGETITIKTTGVEAVPALAALSALVQDGFGENL